MGVGVQAFDAARQLCKLAQQLGLFAARCASNLSGHIGQVALRVVQRARHLARHGQTQQSHHAVSFNFQKALNSATQAAWVHAGHTDNLAAKTVSVQAKVGVHLGLAFADGGTHQAGFVQLTARQGMRAFAFVNLGRHHHEVQAHQPFAWQSLYPLRADMRNGSVFKAILAGTQWAPKSVGLKFGVLLPSQPHVSQLNAEVAGAGGWQRKVAVAQQAVQVFTRRRAVDA